MASFSLRYAHALAQVVEAAKLDTHQVLAQLNDFAATLLGSRELHELLSNPSFESAQKLKVLSAIGEKIGYGQQVRNFLMVLIDHDRLNALREVIDEYHTITDQDSHIVEAQVISMYPLNDDDRVMMEKKVAQLAGSNQVRATYTQDASLLGGAIVKIGSTVYDGSVKAQLERLRQQLVSA